MNDLTNILTGIVMLLSFIVVALMISHNELNKRVKNIQKDYTSKMLYDMLHDRVYEIVKELYLLEEFLGLEKKSQKNQIFVKKDGTE